MKKNPKPIKIPNQFQWTLTEAEIHSSASQILLQL